MFIVHAILINNFTFLIFIRIKTFDLVPINTSFLLSYTLKKKNYLTTLFYIKLFINIATLSCPHNILT